MTSLIQDETVLNPQTKKSEDEESGPKLFFDFTILIFDILLR